MCVEQNSNIGCAEGITPSDRNIDDEIRSMQPRFLLLLDGILFVSIARDLRRTLRTGVARGKWGSFSRERNPQRFSRYVYASYVMIAFCVIVLFWVILKPGWWTAP